MNHTLMVSTLNHGIQRSPWSTIPYFRREQLSPAEMQHMCRADGWPCSSKSQNTQEKEVKNSLETLTSRRVIWALHSIYWQPTTAKFGIFHRGFAAMSSSPLQSPLPPTLPTRLSWLMREQVPLRSRAASCQTTTKPPPGLGAREINGAW